jgi:membrane-bound serine protease (ClpP class)
VPEQMHPANPTTVNPVPVSPAFRPSSRSLLRVGLCDRGGTLSLGGFRSTHMRRAVASLLLVLGVVFSLGSSATAANASTTDAGATDASATDATDSSAAKKAKKGSPAGLVNVIEVSGFIDLAVRNFIVRSVDEAVANKAQLLVIQLNSRGSLLSPNDLDALETRLRNEKRIPVAVWVGGGAAPRAYGGAARILAAADVAGLARLAKVGKSTPTADPNDALLGPAMNFKEAQAAKVFTIDAPVLPEFVGQLDGKTVNGRLLDTAEDAKAPKASKSDKSDKSDKSGKSDNSTTEAGRQTKQLRGVRFAKMNVLERLFHIGSNQTVAYFLFVIALAMFVFEFFTGGIGIAAAVGLGAFVLAIPGLGALPTRPVGIALLLLAMVGFAIDIQSGTPRFWTAVGTASFVIGSLVLFTNGIRVPWFAIGLITVMVLLFMVNGMPTMVRTRFATPTIGRESMIGELGIAAAAVNPDGVVTVLGAPWRARTNRATPITAGAQIRVVGIDGLLLEVEPLEGAAKDAGH